MPKGHGAGSGSPEFSADQWTKVLCPPTPSGLLSSSLISSSTFFFYLFFWSSSSLPQAHRPFFFSPLESLLFLPLG